MSAYKLPKGDGQDETAKEFLSRVLGPRGELPDLLIEEARKVRSKAEADLGPIEPGQRVDLLADNIGAPLTDLRLVAAIVWGDAKGETS